MTTNNATTANPGAAPARAEQINAQAVRVGGAVAEQVAPRYAGVIEAVAEEEPVLFHLLMALMHSR